MQGRIVFCGLFVAFVVGCGGTVAGGGDGGTSTAPGGDAGDGGTTTLPSGDGGTSASCPPSAPSSGSTCPAALANVDCEYGTDPRVHCNTDFVCQPSGTWAEATAGTFCPPLAPADPSCPASLAAASGAASCAREGLICAYGDRLCDCSACDGVCGTMPHFHCDSAPTTPGCPSRRPNLGSSCSVEGTSCTYGTCAGGTIVNETCTKGVWIGASSACPV
jgi:hypothetical protein